MMQTYKAILRGDRVEWVGDGPLQSKDQPVDVRVTILGEVRAASDSSARGVRMAEALDRLASADPFSEVTDPGSWQREVRQDRRLPGRE